MKSVRTDPRNHAPQGDKSAAPVIPTTPKAAEPDSAPANGPCGALPEGNDGKTGAAESIRTNPRGQAVKGDERIRTAEQALGTDPVYARLGSGFAVTPGDPNDICPLCGILRPNAGFLRATCGDGFTEPGCFVVRTSEERRDG